MNYDIIGDIHGNAEELHELLHKLGYKCQGDVWWQKNRKAIFVGDYIDRGPAQIETINTIRATVENGNALAIMGNHELNAVGFASRDRSFDRIVNDTGLDINNEVATLRRRTKDNIEQHKAFLQAIELDSREHHEIIDWFKTLPIFIEVDGLRVVHACWHPESIEALSVYLDDKNRLREDAWHEAFNPDSELYSLIETVIKGPEICLPEGITFRDSYDRIRTKARTRWWLEPDVRNYQEVTLANLPQVAAVMPAPAADFGFYRDPVPLFFGHYWMSGIPSRQTPFVACLDYSIGAKSSKTSDRRLVAYRFDGEAIINDEKFVWVSPAADKN